MVKFNLTRREKRKISGTFSQGFFGEYLQILPFPLLLSAEWDTKSMRGSSVLQIIVFSSSQWPIVSTGIKETEANIALVDS